VGRALSRLHRHHQFGPQKLEVEKVSLVLLAIMEGHSPALQALPPLWSQVCPMGLEDPTVPTLLCADFAVNRWMASLRSLHSPARWQQSPLSSVPQTPTHPLTPARSAGQARLKELWTLTTIITTLTQMEGRKKIALYATRARLLRHLCLVVTISSAWNVQTESKRRAPTVLCARSKSLTSCVFFRKV